MLSIILFSSISITLMLVGVPTNVQASGKNVTPECEELESLAKLMNTTTPTLPISRECLQNSHCTGINCHVKFNVNLDNTPLPQSWLQPFCYAFELMSCKSPIQVLIRLINDGVGSNDTYYFTKSEMRPVEKFSTKFGMFNFQLYLNVTFHYDPYRRSATFGVMSAVKQGNDIIGPQTSYPEWGKIELIPISNFTVAKCTPDTNFIISQNPCVLVPRLPNIQPTTTPFVIGNCSMTAFNGCGKHQMCVPDSKRGGDSGICMCAEDAIYDKKTKTCELYIPQPPVTGSPTAIPPKQTGTDTVIPTVQAHNGKSKLGLYIAVGITVAILLFAAASAAIFILHKRARRRGNVRVLLADDGQDTMLLGDQDEEDFQISGGTLNI